MQRTEGYGDEGDGAMKLFAECYLLLIRISVLLRRADMEALHTWVRSQRVLTSASCRPNAGELCKAMDIVSVFFPDDGALSPAICCNGHSPPQAWNTGRDGHRCPDGSTEVSCLG